MRPIVQTELNTIRHQEEQLKAKDAQLQSLGLSLAQEKAKGLQKDAQINQLGQEFAQMKFDILMLKGSVGQ